MSLLCLTRYDGQQIYVLCFLALFFFRNGKKLYRVGFKENYNSFCVYPTALHMKSLLFVRVNIFLNLV